MSAPVRVLHLDDNPVDAQLVSMMLELDRKKLPTTLTYVQTEPEFRAALERKDFDVILSDYRMPNFDGDQALLLAREMCPEVPFIMVTGELGEDRAIDTVKRGASDYVLKGNMIRLVPAIERALAEAENSRKRREAEMERERLLRDVQESEGRVRRKLANMLSPDSPLEMFDLADLLDVPALQKLMDDFYAVAHIPMSLVDAEGRVLVGVGWQEICTRYHRAHEETCRHCRESDLELSANLAQGEFRLYKCKNNMWDLATPIFIGGRQLGSVFSGQFFFEGESIDRDVFRTQARRYGFDEGKYLAALDRVPRLSREQVEQGTAFFLKLADTLSRLGQSNISLARLLAERERLAQSLREEQEQLTQARENSQLLESFAYSVSHDLKAPLRVINAYARALAGLGETDLTPRQQEAVRTIQQSAGRMEELIEALLEFSRVSRQELNRYPVDTRRMVEEVIREQRQSLGEGTGDRVTVELGELPPVVADPPLLRQVFANLLSNAFKFTRKSPDPRIRVEAERRDDQVVFRISDNGVGFPQEKAGALFSVFQRLHPVREFEGTGIGLANVRKIIERHGGWVAAEGGDGTGAVFSFSLPLAAGRDTPG